MEWDTETKLYKYRPIGYLQSSCNIPAMKPIFGAEPIEYATWKLDSIIYHYRIIIVECVLTENAADAFDYLVNGSIQMALW